jgi:hypothetical protein
MGGDIAHEVRHAHIEHIERVKPGDITLSGLQKANAASRVIYTR